MADPADFEQYRKQLAALARRKDRRNLGWPRDWNPGAVLQPESGLPFTEAGAWHFIADSLEAGHPVQTIVLQNPPGVQAFVMLVELSPSRPAVYIKIHFGAGTIIGRSFHYSRSTE